MKTNFRKLRYNMWFYFIIFTLVIICTVWLFQVFFWETYYQKIKVESLKEYGEELTDSVDSPSSFELLVSKCKETGTEVYLVKDYTVIYPNSAGNASLSDFDETGVLRYAIDSYVKKKTDVLCSTYTFKESSSADIFFYISSVNYGDATCFLILTSPHEKLNEMLKIFQTQFLIVAIIVIFIGFFLAWYLSIKLSKPIDDMSATAKKWAEGDNSVIFKAGGYSEIAELAEALNYAKEGVSKAGVLQRDLIANVSHDLKTPLTMIKAYAEMIKDISGDNKQKRDKHTQVIIDEADRLTMLVNDILNLSKLQSDVDTLEITQINLSELIETVIARFSAYVEMQGFKIEKDIEPDLFIDADGKKIEQVIYNLIGNSINYTGEDKTVNVFLSSDGDKILLEIIDSGKGIKKDKLDSIWERYYRFSETNTRPVKGTGLGLSIVKTILDAHKIKFGVISKPDCGSNFFVEFKRCKDEK